MHRTVVANGQFPGPLISANTGDNLQLNVVDSLTDTTMRRATSVVSIYILSTASAILKGTMSTVALARSLPSWYE